MIFEEQINYYAIIPAPVRYDKGLTPNAKLLYGEITALSNKKGYCWATNKHFAELYQTSEKTITRWVKSLEEKGYIKSDVSTFRYDDGTVKKIRKIYIDNFVPFQEYNFSSDHTDENVFNHMDKNVPLKNKIDNNKVMNNKDIEYIVDYLNKKAKTNYRYKSADTQKHIKARLNEGYTVDDFKTVIDKKVDEWNGTDMSKYLRPSTLFGSKFESYLNQPEKQVDFQKTPWKVGGKPNYDIDKITRDTLFNDDFDVD